MGDNNKVLRFCWRATNVDKEVDMDKCKLFDAVIEYEAKKRHLKLDYGFPKFKYIYQM